MGRTMTTYKTGNPLGSTAVKDLYDNSENFDYALNGGDPTWVDRLGKVRKSWSLVESSIDSVVANANAVIAGMGYQVPVPYESGINLTLPTQTVSYNGQVYAPNANALPFTTSGSFEEDSFRLIQGVSGADLSSSYGASMVGFLQNGDEAVLRSAESKMRDIVSLKDFGAVGDGVTDDSDAVHNWMRYVLNSGGIGIAPSGTYLLGKGVTAQLSASAKFIVDSDAEFVAAPGFPQGNKMIMIVPGAGTGHSFTWEGGRFDAVHQPNSLPGEACDIFYFSVNNADYAKVSLDRTYTGDNQFTSSGDSHLFMSGATYMEAEVKCAIGARDAGIYVSSDFSGNIGQGVVVKGNFYRCQVGAVVKRRFENVRMDIIAHECSVGGAISPAEVTSGIFPGGDNCIMDVIAYRCETGAILIGTASGNVRVSCLEMGLSIPDYTATSSTGLRLSGARNINAMVSLYAVNANTTRNSNFIGVALLDTTIGETPYSAVDNYIVCNATGIGKTIHEYSGADRNTLIAKSRSNLTDSVRNGAVSTLYEHTPGQPIQQYWGSGHSTTLATAGVNLIPRSTLAEAGPFTAGGLKYITNGRRTGQTAGNGTGVLAYADGTAWRRASDDSPVEV